MRRYFERAEYGKLIETIMSNPEAPIEELGSFIYWQGADTFYKKFMPQEGIPFFVWWVGGMKSKHQYYVNEIMSQTAALKAGDEILASGPQKGACSVGCVIV